MGKSAMADTTKTTASPTGHMTYTQAPAACEKNIFDLFRFTQPVKNHTYSCNVCSTKSLFWLGKTENRTWSDITYHDSLGTIGETK